MQNVKDEFNELSSKIEKLEIDIHKYTSGTSQVNMFSSCFFLDFDDIFMINSE